jgi:hypothetical protein
MSSDLPKDGRQWLTSTASSSMLASTMDASTFANDVRLAFKAVIGWLLLFLSVKHLLKDVVPSIPLADAQGSALD